LPAATQRLHSLTSDCHFVVRTFTSAFARVNLKVRTPSLVRPVRIGIGAGAGDLSEILSVPRHCENLRFPGTRRTERDMPAVRRETRAFVRPLAKCQLPDRSGRQFQHFDVVARTCAGRVRDLVVRRRRPCRAVRFLFVGQLTQAEPIDADDIDLRRA